MITLSVILLLVFVPQSRRLLSGLLWGVFSVVGLIFLAAPDTRPRRRGL
jgi:hypothetical protein